MTRTRIARAAGVAVGIAAILFFGLTIVAAYALGGGVDVVLPAVLGIGAIVGTALVARGQAVGALLVAAAIAVALGRGLMVGAFDEPAWLAALIGGIGVEVLVAIGLTNPFDRGAAEA